MMASAPWRTPLDQQHSTPPATPDQITAALAVIADRHDVTDDEPSCVYGVRCPNPRCAAWHRDEICLREIGAALDKARLRPAAHPQEGSSLEETFANGAG